MQRGGIENIQVSYDNIKVYKDNVKYDLKDTSGKTVEPFVYNGTTYLPLRSVASLTGMDVKWDNATKSVYLWDEMSAYQTAADLMEVCPPYEKDIACREYLKVAGDTFVMAGKHYTNGLTFGSDFYPPYALFNLDGKYSVMNLVVGHVDDTSMDDVMVTFIVDGDVAKEVKVSAKSLPQDISVPLNQGKQLKIMVDGNSLIGQTGLGNITVR